MLSAMNSTGIISGYMEVGRVYTGKKYIKKITGQIISIIVAILISIVITVQRLIFIGQKKLGEVRNMQKRDLIQANASLENLRQNLDMKDLQKKYFHKYFVIDLMSM